MSDSAAGPDVGGRAALEAAVLREALDICHSRASAAGDFDLVNRWWHSAGAFSRGASTASGMSSSGSPRSAVPARTGAGAEKEAVGDDASAGEWCALGGALMDEARHADAMEAFQRALARKPDCLRARVGLAHALVAQGRPAEAIPHFEAGLALEPLERWAHFGLGWSELLVGAFARGWKELTWFNRNGVPRPMDSPVWSGEPLSGRTLFVWADWALGDTVQHLRYLPLVKSSGARVVVECDKTLLALVQGMSCVDLAVATGTPSPRHDLHISLSSLAGLLSATFEQIPSSVPYLQVSTTKCACWRRRLGESTRPTVGLVWTGDKSHAEARARFLTLPAFRPLADVRGVRFVSLQVGRPALEVWWERTLQVENVLTERCTLEDTAAVIMNLDLAVTVDTMVAHLAGALGQRVWTLLPSAPAWQWRMDGDSSAWYPTMRLYRQAGDGTWDRAIESVSRDLQMLFARESAR